MIDVSAARHIIHMVWLYRLPIIVGRRGVLYLLKRFLLAFAAPRGEGGETSTKFPLSHKFSGGILTLRFYGSPPCLSQGSSRLSLSTLGELFLETRGGNQRRDSNLPATETHLFILIGFSSSYI